MKEDRAAMTRDVASRDTVEPSEDILICVDVDAESTVEMKTTETNGRPLNRLECVKQAITRFIHDKLATNPNHRFAFATLSKSAAWVILSPRALFILGCFFFAFEYACSSDEKFGIIDVHWTMVFLYCF